MQSLHLKMLIALLIIVGLGGLVFSRGGFVNESENADESEVIDPLIEQRIAETDTVIESNIVYKTSPEYGGHESLIEFYSDNSTLINSFNIRENNPYVPESARQRYVSGEVDSYNMVFEVEESEREQFKELFNTTEKIDAIETYYDVDNRSPILNYTVVAYSGFAKDNVIGNFSMSCYVFIFNNKGKIERKLFLPDQNCFSLSISPSGKFISYANDGVYNNAENAISEEDFKIIDVSSGEDVLNPVVEAIHKMFSIEPKYFAFEGGVFLNDGTFTGSGGIKGDFFLFIADFDNGQFYIRTYKAGEGADYIKNGELFWRESRTEIVPIDYTKFQTIVIK